MAKAGEINRNPRTKNERERKAWERGVSRNQGASRGTANRLVEYDTSLQLNPVDSLTKYIKGIENNIDIVDLGDGTVRVKVSDILSIVGLVLSGGLVFGSYPSVNGDYRIIQSGTKLNIERMESNVWVKEGAFGPRS